MTATYELVRDLGWPYFEKLAQQNVAGAVGFDRRRSRAWRARRAGRWQRVQPVPAQGGWPAGRAVYASEGTPLIVGPNGPFKNAPNPNAAPVPKLLLQPECQQLVIDAGACAGAPQNKESKAAPPGRSRCQRRCRGVEKARRRDQGVAASYSRFEVSHGHQEIAITKLRSQNSPDATSSRVTALAAAAMFAEPVRAPLPPQAITPALIEA